MLASREGHTRLVALLVSSGAAVNLCNLEGSAALHDAASGGHQAIVRRLLWAGARSDLVQSRGYTALQLGESNAPWSLSWSGSCDSFDGLGATIAALLIHGTKPRSAAP